MELLLWDGPRGGQAQVSPMSAGTSGTWTALVRFELLLQPGALISMNLSIGCIALNGRLSYLAPAYLSTALASIAV